MKLKMPVSDALITAVLGYLVVFVGLALLMVVVIIMGKIMVSRKKTAAVAAPAAAPAAVPVPAKASPEAPGSAGEIKIHDVPDREAAMIMAIVANKLRKPLNELRFKSIKEIK